MKILILKPSSLGDVIHALPVLRLLKRHLPEAQIYWWLAAGLTPLLEKDPDLAGIIPFARHRWKNPLDWSDYLHRIQEMRQHEFDLVIDLQGLARSGLFGWLANGKLTIGLDIRREGARGFHDITVPRPSPDTHAVDWYLELLRVLQIPTSGDYTWLPQRDDVAARLRKLWPVNSHRWLIINPGARWLNKRWPVEHYAKLAMDLAAEHPDVHFAIMGAESERDLSDVICQRLPGRSLNLAGATTLPEMIEWIRLGEIMITNDTGPMHVAAALGKPVVAMFGPTDPRRTGPYRQINEVLRHHMECAPCMKSNCHFARPLECLRAIPSELVRQTVSRRLSGTGA